MGPLRMGTWREIFYDLIGEVKPEDEWELKMVQGLTPKALPWDWTQVVEEHGLASFCCSHCERMWNSAQAVILFHIHLDQTGAGGQVRMRTFKQQCHLCSVWAEPVFSQNSARRILSDLVTSIQQKCYGEDVVRPRLQEAVARWHSAPHESEHCEACHLGVHRGMHRGHHGRPSSMGPQKKPGDTAIPWGSRVPVGSVQLPAPYQAVDTFRSNSGDIIPCCVCAIFLILFVIIYFSQRGLPGVPGW